MESPFCADERRSITLGWYQKHYHLPGTLAPGITPGLSKMWHQGRLQEAMPGSQGRAQWCACSCSWEVQMCLKISAKIWVSSPLCFFSLPQTRLLLPLTAQTEWETKESELLQALSGCQNQSQKICSNDCFANALYVAHTHADTSQTVALFNPTAIWIYRWYMDYIWMCKNSFA